MEYLVKLANCQQHFTLQENETILEAAIRAGISLNYGCSSGTCGLCKANLLEGRVEQIKSHDFAISESGKLQGQILTCVNTASSNLVLDALTARNVEDIPVQSMNVKVRKVERVADEVYKLVVQTPRTNRLRFMAGQYVELTASDSARGNFAIASCPCEDRILEFHIRALEQDPFAKLVSCKLKIGDTLELSGPYGKFVYDEYAQRNIILFAFDTGFAAIKSLLEHITAQENDLPIHLIWMSCSDGGLYMHNLCRAWRDAFDNFSYAGIALHESFQQLAGNPEKSRATVESHLDAALNNYDDLSAYDVYVSAPDPAIDIFRSVCLEKKMFAERFFSEPIRGNEDMTCIVHLET